ncbi:MAG TPA: hypothetical protein VIH57_00260 [Bacteroidales bacterium]
MKTLPIFVSASLIAALLLSSCKKESAGPSTSVLGVKIQATGKTFSLLKSVSLTTPGFVWDTSFMNVSKIEFEAEKSESETSHDSSEIHLEWNGSKKVDLFSLNSVIGNIPLQPGVYHEITLKIKAYKADAGSSPVFYLEGTYTNSVDSVTPIVVIVNEDFEFKVKKEGFTLDAVNDYTSLINMNLSLLMSGISASDLSSATLTNGRIIISSSSNTSLYSKIRTSLSSCEESEFEQGKGKDNGSDSGKSNGNDSGNGDGSGSHSGGGNYY